MRDVLSLATFVIGFVLGLLQPLVAVAVGVGLVAGPTFAGLALALGIGLFVPSLVRVWLFRTGRALSVPLAMVSGTLALGVIGGTVFGTVLQIPTRLGRPATYVPSSGMPSFPVVQEAPGAVSLRLAAVPDFAVSSSEPVEGGLFGHWCYSGLDTAEVARVEAELGTIGARSLIGTVTIPAPESPTARVQLMLRGIGGEPWLMWTGQGRLSDVDGTMGMVAFEDLAADSSVAVSPATLSGEMSWNCAAWRP